MNSTSKVRTLAILLLLAIGIGGYFWNQSRTLRNDNKGLNTEVSMLEELRLSLLDDVEGLQTDVSDLLVENDSLEIIFEEKTEEIAARDKAIKKIKTDFATDASGMRLEIEQLKSIKQDLSTLVMQLQAENARLLDSNEALALEVTNMQIKTQELEFDISELRQLNADFEKDRKNLLATSTRATNLRIDLLKKGEKPTGSFRRAREVNVSFDIKNLPESKEGERRLYLVIKDSKGVPIEVANPTYVVIKPESGGKSEEIIAQQVITSTLYNNSRFQFKISPTEGTLHKGYYRVAIYAKWGLLGGAEFQLR